MGLVVAGCALHLAEAELVARNTECFSTANSSIAKSLQLPDFEHSAQLAWPPPKPSMAVQVATSMIHHAHPGANWWQESKERARAMRGEYAHVIMTLWRVPGRSERSACKDSRPNQSAVIFFKPGSLVAPEARARGVLKM
jgi:hypothetical protein